MEKILNESKMVPKSVFSSITQTWNGVENQHDGWRTYRGWIIGGRKKGNTAPWIDGDRFRY